MLGSRLCFSSDKKCSCRSPPPPLPKEPQWPSSSRPEPPWIIIVIVIVCVLLAALVIIAVVYRRMRQKKRKQQVGDQDCELRSKNGSTASTSNLVQRGNGNACAQAADGPAK